MTQTWLTQEAADRLRAELTQLEGPGRKEVTAKIEAARAEGDLKKTVDTTQLVMSKARWKRAFVNSSKCWKMLTSEHRQ
jgi:transcription elongation GreA/GreB family factor